MGKSRYPPFHKNRLTKRAQKNFQTNVHTKSRRTGLSLIWENVAGFEQIMATLESRSKVDATQVLSSISFESWLNQQNINANNLCRTVEFGYRFANPIFGPLTIVGSISDGGRFNIGGAQIRTEFPMLIKQGCLYLSSTINCALEEAAQPHGKNKMFKIKFKYSPKLWDLNMVIEKLNSPGLLDTVKQAQGEKLWVLQKYPSISQILGAKLRAIGGDGIIFNSTKVEADFNIALFFATDDEAKNKLEFEEVPIK